MRRVLVLLLVPIWIAVGCAKRPVLYPNAYYEQVGEVVAQEDIDDCIALAENADLDTNQAAEAAKKTGAGAAVGTATGAATGAIRGGAGTGALIGLVSGSIIGFFSWMFGASEPDPVFVNYVDRCLSERGYESIGWK